MAKKKIRKSKSSSRNTRGKKVVKKSSGTQAESKTTANKSAKKSTAATSGPVKETKPRKRPGPMSVDNILRKFKKERVNLDSSLLTVRKKIEELIAKTRAFEEQIAELTSKETATEEAIEQLDAKRDTEVNELLEKLGVKLGSPKEEEPATSSSPFAVLLHEASESSPDEGNHIIDEDEFAQE